MKVYGEDPLIVASAEHVVLVMDHFDAGLLASHLTSNHPDIVVDDLLCDLGGQINQAIAVTKATVVVPFRGSAS